MTVKNLIKRRFTVKSNSANPTGMLIGKLYYFQTNLYMVGNTEKKSSGKDFKRFRKNYVVSR